MSSINYLDNQTKRMIGTLGKKWRKSKQNKKLKHKLVLEWNKVLKEWIDDPSMPLVIRKSQKGLLKGNVVKHKATGRELIRTDNSFSHWVYYHIWQSEKAFTLLELKEKLKKGDIPFVYINSLAQRKVIKYKMLLGEYCINKFGLKLCHIRPVGINKRGKIEDMPIDDLKNHFMKLSFPSNMFTIPLSIGGLGEIDDFIQQQKNNFI